MVRVWDSASGVELLALPGPGAFSDVTFSPDGTRLAAAAAGGQARIYILPLEELVALAKTRVTRSLTEEECRKFLHVDKCSAVPAP